MDGGKRCDPVDEDDVDDASITIVGTGDEGGE